MNKEEIQNYLKYIVSSAKLPSQTSFEINGNCLLIKVSGRGTVANMQTDQSAFEGWAIVLKAAITNIKNVILDWEDPIFIPNKENAQQAHYNRFIMRVANFKKAYSWFNVTQHRKEEIDNMQELLNSKSIVINYPKKPCSPLTDKNKKPEAVLERELVKKWRENCPITDEQLPVGLFNYGSVSKANTLTPRGASQIDLWQLDGTTLRIFELKVKGNESIGIISELMFYICTIKNVVDGLIKYPDLNKVKSERHFKDFANAVKDGKINKIVGYFTASKFHSLIESDELKNSIKGILNDNTFGIVFEYKDISNLKF